MSLKSSSLTKNATCSNAVKQGMWVLLVITLSVVLDSPLYAQAAPGLPAVSVTNVPGGGQTWSLSLQVLLLMTAISVLPSLMLAMTSFTRIMIVMALLRQALGTGQTPSNQVLVGLSLFLTAFIMGPVIDQSWIQGIAPYLDQKMTLDQAWVAAIDPFRNFMLANVRENDLMLFAKLAGIDGFANAAAVKFPVLVAAFVTSELRTAFEIGFLLFVPFVIIDLIVASILMSMGMMMMSPMLVSAPFKILLFVLVDGWALIVGSLAGSFRGIPL
jgi:flagellar biosynthetic protein FliP